MLLVLREDKVLTFQTGFASRCTNSRLLHSPAASPERAQLWSKNNDEPLSWNEAAFSMHWTDVGKYCSIIRFVPQSFWAQLMSLVPHLKASYSAMRGTTSQINGISKIIWTHSFSYPGFLRNF